ncbi:hypothetical protein GQ457_07G033710 [Hibiscus cannabinus]
MSLFDFIACPCEHGSILKTTRFAYSLSLSTESLYLPWQIKQQTQKRFPNLSKPSSLFFPVLSLCFFYT